MLNEIVWNASFKGYWDESFKDEWFSLNKKYVGVEIMGTFDMLDKLPNKQKLKYYFELNNLLNKYAR